MPRGKAHPPELRASAQALLLAGHSQAEVCGITGLPQRTVSHIAAPLQDKLAQVGLKKQDTDTDLIMGYFRAALRAMISQAEVFGDPEYCRTQEAHNLAIAHGVLGDKFVGVAATAQALGLIGQAIQDTPELSAPD